MSTPLPLRRRVALALTALGFLLRTAFPEQEAAFDIKLTLLFVYSGANYIHGLI